MFLTSTKPFSFLSRKLEVFEIRLEYSVKRCRTPEIAKLVVDNDCEDAQLWSINKCHYDKKSIKELWWVFTMIIASIFVT